MATVLEQVTNTAEKEAERHNRLIKERYEQLLSAEEEQLNESLSSVAAPVTEERESSTTYSAPVYTAPSVAPSYSHEKVQSTLFTTETLDRQIAEVGQTQRETYAPQAVAPTIAQKTVVEQKVEAVSYAFSNFAKAMVAAFAVLVVVMLTIISVNSRAISNNRIKIKRLEDKRQELEEKNSEIAARMQEVTSEEYVKSWGEANGFVFD